MRPTNRSGFTMTEILVVIGIIVIALFLAVPTFNIITGSNSINAAENTVSAMLGRARGEALGLQRHTGVFFFVDPASQRVTLAQVAVLEPRPTGAGATRDVYLDLVPDRDVLQLPAGVSAQLIDNAVMNAGNPSQRDDDGYVGFNEFGPGGVMYGGVILFDGNGRLDSRTYGFDLQTDAGAPTAMAELLGAGTGSAVFNPPPLTGLQPVTAFGLAMFETEPFVNRFGPIAQSYPDHQAVSTGAMPPAIPPDGTGEADEEFWLDENSTPLMINRYTGTLVRGE